MRKILFTIVALLTLWACNNDDFVQNSQPEPMAASTNLLSRSTTSGLEVDQQILFLEDNGTREAGKIVVTASVPEVSIQWNVLDSCNLDTTRTYLSMSNGKADLDIKWKKMYDDGRFAPGAKAFNLGVLISDGSSSIYVHLILSTNKDIENFSTVLTRSASEATVMAPRTSITCYPDHINMAESIGGYTWLETIDAAPVGLFFDKIGTFTNIDFTGIPKIFRTEADFEELNFPWNAAGAPDIDFETSFTVSGLRSGLSMEVPITYYKQNAPTLTITPNTFEVPATGQTLTAQINTNQTKWDLQNLTSIPDWITYNPTTGGTGMSALNLTIAPNTTMEPRYATLFVKSGSLTKGIDITQLGLTPELTVAPQSFPNIKAAGDNMAVTVTSNTGWRVTTSAPWLHASPINGTGNGAITFTAEANTGNDPRTATATVSTLIGTMPVTQTITFTQDGAIIPSLTVSKTSFDIPSSGQTVSASVTSNTAWSATSSAAWLQVTPTSGTGNATMNFVAGSYTGNTPRTATVTIRTTSGSPAVERTITFTQAGTFTPGTGGITIDDWNNQQDITVDGGKF